MEQLPRGYNREEIWKDVREELEKLPDLCHTHYQNITVRMNGEDRVFEADWLKYLQLVMVHYPEEV